VVKARARLFAELVKAGFVENLVQAAVERVTRSLRQLASIPQRLLSLSLLPRAHRHDPILGPKHSHVKMFFDFRHGLLRRNPSAVALRAVRSGVNVKLSPEA